MRFREMAKIAIYDAALKAYNEIDEFDGADYTSNGENFTPAQLRDFKFAMAKEVNRIGNALAKTGTRVGNPLPERRKRIKLPPSRPEGL